MRLKGRWPYDFSKSPSVDGGVRVAARCGCGNQAAGEPCVAVSAADIGGVGFAVWVAVVEEAEGVGVADFVPIRFFGAR